MQLLLFALACFSLTLSCQNYSNATNPTNDSLVREVLKKYPAPHVDSSIKPSLSAPRSYTGLEYWKKETINAAGGTKSVIFNAAGTRLYAMNLEGMSVYEFDQATRKINREFKFTPTRGMGWDYNKSRPIPSYQEKPVEACLSHDDQILWVSLHNAGGIVPIWLNDFSKNTKPIAAGQPYKPVTVVYPGLAKKDSFSVPLIETGKTPKVIARTRDSRYLLVSNWHSRTTSILEMNKEQYPYASIISTVGVPAIPRGIALDEKSRKTYVAIMGGATLTVINNDTWQAMDTIHVLSNPRHIVMDTSGHLFVSYNSLGLIACLDAATGQSLFTASTHAQPRTIVLSKNHQFIFVTCYSSDYVDVYKINADNFEKIASLPCGGHPVGVDLFEDDEKVEAWVCSYSSGSISIFSFHKK